MPIDLTIPGSKSITNRALVLAALANKTVKIQNYADCDDTKYMTEGLKKLGIKISQTKKELKVKGNGGKFKKSKKPINIFTGNAGTTTRFLTALATLTENKVIIDGDKRMRERPIEELVKALNKLGAKVKTKEGCPPVHIFPKKLKGGSIKLPGNISSQYISAILMIAPFAENDTNIKIVQKLYSKPYINMTIKVMKAFGITVMNKKFEQFIVKTLKRSPKSLTNYKIESDTSSASYFGAYAALHPSCKITLKNIHKKSLQGDIEFLKYLQKMGCKITELKKGIKVLGPKTLKSLGKIDMNKTPDLVMTFAALSMFTKGKTKITNVANLRIKETDRLSALKNEIKKFGIKVKTGKDYIEIEGNPDLLTHPQKKQITIKTYNDHRIAMSFGILQDLFPKLKILNPHCVSKSYPSFWKDLKKAQKSCQK